MTSAEAMVPVPSLPSPTGSVLGGQEREQAIFAAILTRARSQNTRDAYATDLRGFAAWAEERGLPLFSMTRDHIEQWYRDQDSAPASIKRRLSAIQQFYLEAQDRGFVDRVPTLRVVRPRVAQDQKLGITKEQALQLLEVAAKSGPRDELLVRLLLLNGLRVSEAIGLTAGSLGEEAGHRVIRFTSKGGKLRREPLAPETAMLADAYLARRIRPTKTSPLIPRNDGRPMDRFEAARITQALGKKAGIKGRLNPHELRHAFVTLSRQAGVSLQDVQESAGHADPKTTAGYDRARNKLESHATYRLAEFLS